MTLEYKLVGGERPEGVRLPDNKIMPIPEYQAHARRDSRLPRPKQLLTDYAADHQGYIDELVIDSRTQIGSHIRVRDDRQIIWEELTPSQWAAIVAKSNRGEYVEFLPGVPYMQLYRKNHGNGDKIVQVSGGTGKKKGRGFFSISSPKAWVAGGIALAVISYGTVRYIVPSVTGPSDVTPQYYRLDKSEMIKYFNANFEALVEEGDSNKISEFIEWADRQEGLSAKDKIELDKLKKKIEGSRKK